MKKPYRLKKRSTVYYYLLPGEKTFHSTGQTSLRRAESWVVDLIRRREEEQQAENRLTLSR